MFRKPSIPLNPAVKVATALPCAHRLGFPCLACGSPVDLEQVYCPACRLHAAMLEKATKEFEGPGDQGTKIPRAVVFLRMRCAA